ncbi:MAG: hypothetical protein ABI683_01495 [Ginsengibacter sp.]
MIKILIPIFLIAGLYSCKKDVVNQKDIEGSWEYSTFIGYPFNYPTLPPGNGHVIVIKRNGLFERKSHDTTIFKGVYTLRWRKDCGTNTKQAFFKTREPNSTESIISVMNDSLLLSSSSCLADGGVAIYKRK